MGGFKLGFWFAQQGSIYVFIILIFVYIFLMNRLDKNYTFLATVGSTAPFIGLFGTVWGIMNSFQSIAESKNTSLAVVAPGIAEALFATALGLAAAIPAVVAYNKFSADLDKIGSALDVFAQEFSTLLGRQLDEGNK